MSNVKTKPVKTKPVKTNRGPNFTKGVFTRMILNGEQEEINKKIREEPEKVFKLLSLPSIKELLNRLLTAGIDEETEAFYKSLLIPEE